MSDQTDLSPRGRLAFGMLFVLAGLPILLIGLGVLKPDPAGIHAPLWVIACAGLAFMAAGASVALGAGAGTVARDGGLPATAPWPLRAAQYVASHSVVVMLATIGSWIALGPGEREFTSTVSAFGISSSGRGGEMTSRIVFGLGAAMCWLFFVAAAKHGWRKLRNRA